MAVPHFQLANITIIIDNNKLQIDGSNQEVMSVDPIDEKFKSFGWQVAEINGHDFAKILHELKKAKLAKKPVAIIAKTIKGKGAPMAENNFAYHGVPLSCEELATTKKNLQLV